VVRNTGDGPATNVRIVDELPAGLMTENGSRSVQVNIGQLGPGEAKQANFTAKAESTGRFTNRATVTADGGLGADAEYTTIVRQPVLQVSKTGPDVRYIGRTAEYTIVVANTGDTAANQTVLTDDIPPGTEFVGASDGGRLAGGNVTWSLGTIEPGGSRTVTVQVRALRAGTVRNTATARAICAEDAASAEMEIKGIPAILLEVVDVEDPIEVGSTITYVITVTNQGSAMGTNIVLACTLPQQQSYVSSDGPTRGAIDGQMVTFAALPSLAPKAQATYRLVAKGVAPGDVRFKVSMTTDQQPTPVEETESTNVY